MDRRPILATIAMLVGITSACSLFVDSGDLSGASDAVDAGGDAPIVIADATTDASATSDAPSTDADAAAASPCVSVDPSRVLCEDYDRGYDLTQQECVDGGASLDTTTPSSPPASLLLDVAPNGTCSDVSSLGTINSGVELTFKVRVDSLAGRIHVFSLSVGPDVGDRPFVFVNIYPAKVTLGTATPGDGGNTIYSEPRVRAATTPFGKWIAVKLVVDQLATGGRATLTFDGQVVEQPVNLDTWKAGTGSLRSGVNFNEKTSRIALDDLVVRRLP